MSSTEIYFLIYTHVKDKTGFGLRGEGSTLWVPCVVRAGFFFLAGPVRGVFLCWTVGCVWPENFFCNL
jgi:hypothetical protein